MYRSEKHNEFYTRVEHTAMDLTVKMHSTTLLNE